MKRALVSSMHAHRWELTTRHKMRVQWHENVKHIAKRAHKNRVIEKSEEKKCCILTESHMGAWWQMNDPLEARRGESRGTCVRERARARGSKKRRKG